MGIVRIQARMIGWDWLMEALNAGVRGWPLLDWAVGSH